jgi:hypothetical protein
MRLCEKMQEIITFVKRSLPLLCNFHFSRGSDSQGVASSRTRQRARDFAVHRLPYLEIIFDYLYLLTYGQIGPLKKNRNGT